MGEAEVSSQDAEHHMMSCYNGCIPFIYRTNIFGDWK